MSGDWQVQPKEAPRTRFGLGGCMFVFVIAAAVIWFFVRLAAPNDAALITGCVLGGIVALICTTATQNARYNDTWKACVAESRTATQEAVRLLRALVDAVDGAQDAAHAAGGQIARAQQYLTETAFSPFWDSIEKAGGNLAVIRALMVQAAKNLDAYESILVNRAHSFPLSPVSLSDFPDMREYAARFERLVHEAQRDYHFAAIWEQRRTRQTVAEGFRTLGDLVSELTDAVTSTIDGLRQSIDRGNVQLTSAISTGFGENQAELAGIRESSAATAKTACEVSRIIEIRRLLRP